MSDNRPTEWQWRTPEDGKINGLTHAEWEVRGVDVFARREGDDFPNFREKGCGGKFCDLLQYAPATLDGLPAVWPPRMDWQWRRLERDMDARTWRAAVRWYCGGTGDSPVKGPIVCYGFYGAKENRAERGEWWTPADEHGNPCEWPEVEPQPVVVIPAAEMTPLVLYGHQAMGGTWRYRDREPGWDGEDWSTNGGYRCSDVYDSEQWAPCDENGEFCALRQVVSVAEEVIVKFEQAGQQAFEDLGARVQYWQRKAEEAYKDCDEWTEYAYRAVKLWDLGHGLGDVIEEMRRALARKGDEK